jgi:hypothetical protein
LQRNKLVFIILVIISLPACKLVSSSATLTLEVPLPKIILSEVLQKFDGCLSDNGVQVEENNYSFSCRNSADTDYTISISTYIDEEEAKKEFESNRQDNPTGCFHGYNQFETMDTNPKNQYIVHEYLSWLAEKWIITIFASYDYGYFHYTVSDFSDAVYNSGVEHNIFLAGICP